MASLTNRGNLQWRALIRRKGYPTENKTFEIDWKKTEATGHTEREEDL